MVISAVVIFGAGVTIYQHVFKFREVVEQIQSLQVGDVKQVNVYEGDWPKGEPRVVTDSAKIENLIVSLKAGERYFANHDKNNGFERVVIFQPQNLQLRIYQREGDDSGVIVGIGEWVRESSYRSFGSVHCESVGAWLDF